MQNHSGPRFFVLVDRERLKFHKEFESATNCRLLVVDEESVARRQLLRLQTQRETFRPCFYCSRRERMRPIMEWVGFEGYGRTVKERAAPAVSKLIVGNFCGGDDQKMAEKFSEFPQAALADAVGVEFCREFLPGNCNNKSPLPIAAIQAQEFVRQFTT